jgi:DNA-binding NarL/FixJ family response regulator
MPVAPAVTGTNRRAPYQEGVRDEAILIVNGDREAREAIAGAVRRLGRPLVEAATAEQAIEVAERERPAAVIMEVLLPAMSGYELCRAMKDRFGSGLPVIFVSARRTLAADRVAGLLIGADDYLAKPVDPDELLVRVRRLVDATRQPDVMRAGLTLREQEVLGLLADGLQQSEIATRLVITPRTVAKHVEHVLRKLGVHTRTQAVALALRDKHAH